MAKHVSEFTIHLSPDGGMSACRTAISRLGWNTAPSPPSRIVVGFPRSLAYWECRIEVLFAQTGPETTVTLKGEMAWSQRGILKTRMKKLRSAIEDEATLRATIEDAARIDDTVNAVVEIASPLSSADRQPELPRGGRTSQGDPLEQLRKLSELRDAGVLTDAEFEAKKTELLERI